MERAARATRPRQWREAAGARLRVGRAKEKDGDNAAIDGGFVHCCGYGVDTIGAAGQPPAADGACWWDGGVGRAFDEGALAPRVPILASAL